ncbi:DUF6542 domain-containing protein [Streptomyces sp. NPDC001728]|uniref:DUF6542 domain-containing protein n=1 Tax=Streptomyces sp. NPDC001728 TaxID=3154396 RepID=UPI003324002F
MPPFVLALRRLPSPRLTGLGAGLFAAAVMLVLGLLDLLLFDGSPVVYGLLFLPVSALTAFWVRTADLVTAPIGVPIAFAVGVIPIAGGTGGFGGQAMAVVTALAVHAGWLYGGTLVAGVIASVRKVREMGRRQPPRTRPTSGSGGAGGGGGTGGGGTGAAGGASTDASGAGKGDPGAGPARGRAPRRRPVA